MTACLTRDAIPIPILPINTDAKHHGLHYKSLSNNLPRPSLGSSASLPHSVTPWEPWNHAEQDNRQIKDPPGTKNWVRRIGMSAGS